MATNIEKRGELLAVNSFARLYGISREEVMRIVLRGYVKALHIPDGNRYYVDNADLLAQAKAEDIPPGSLVKRFCRHSKR